MRLPRTTALLALPLVAAITFGCAAVETEVAGVDVGLGTREGFAITQPGAALGNDFFLQFQAKKKAAAGLAFLQMSRDLWQPFRFEASAGAFDGDHIPADGAIACTELDGRGTDFGEFYGICAQVIGSGMLVYAYESGSPVAIGQMTFPETREVDFAIEADDMTMTFFARERGDMTWSTIASTEFTGQTIPLIPAVGVSNLATKGVLGFDDFRVVSNSIPPAPPLLEVAAANSIWGALDSVLEGAYALEGMMPDFDAAETLLTQGLAEFDLAMNEVDLLPNGKARKAALKQLKKARKKLDAALQHVIADDSAGAFADLKPALSRSIKAVLKLQPIS